MTRSLDLIVEGIDRGDVRLILSESAAFQSAFNELKGSIDDFIKLIGEVGLEGLKEPYAALDKAVASAEQSLQDMPDEWDWKGQVDTLKKPTGDSPPETMVSKIALDHDTNVNAVKDAVIAIAKGLEPFPEFFNVGSAGITMTDEFKGCVSFPEETALFQFATDDWIYIVTGVDKSSDQAENEKNMKKHWKPMWDPKDTGEEKKWTDFQVQLDKLRAAIESLYDACGKAIQNGQPSADFQSEVPDKGLVKNLLGSLFGGDSGGTTQVDPKKVMGNSMADEKGLLGLDMAKLSALVVGLLEMSGAASDAASGAVEAIDKNQQELSQDIPGEDIRDKLIKGYGEKPKDENDLEGMKKTTKAMVAFREILDKREFTLEDVKKIEDLPEKLSKVSTPYTNEEEVKELMEILELNEKKEETQRDIIEDELKDMLGKVEDDDLRSELQAMLQDQYLEIEDGEVKPPEDLNTDELLADLDKLDDPEGDLDDDFKGELTSLLDPEELPESFVRWRELAGIIKG